MNLRSIPTILILTATPTLVTAQADVRGIFAALPVGVIHNFGSNSKELRYTSGGLPATLDQFASQTNPNVPVYSKTAMFGPLAQLVEIDAMSTGNDLLPITTNGWVDPGNAMWATLLFSVSKTSHGSPGSVVNQKVNSPGGVGAEIFGFYFDNSAIPPMYEANVFLEHSAQDNAALTGAGQEISALDLFMPLIVMTDGQPDPLLMPRVHEFYFSVTKSSAGSLPTTFFDFGPNSGAAILRMDWNPGLGWSTPTVIATPMDLALNADEDVDALAVRDGGATLVFSTDQDPPAHPRPQLLVKKNGGPVVELKRAGGGGIPGGLHLLDPSDDIDGICGADPEVMIYSHLMGEVVNAPVNPAIGLSIGRRARTQGVLDHMIWVSSGWGNGTPGQGLLTHYVTLDFGRSFFPIGSQPRRPSDHAIEFDYTMPTFAAGLGIVVGCYTQFDDWAAGSTTTSHYFGIRL